MRILQCLDSLDPRYGGTVEAGRALTAGLVQEGHAVEAVCLDGPDNKWHEGWPCVVHKLGPGHSPYLYCPALIPWLKANAPRFDVFLVHNVYRYISLGVWKMARGAGVPYYLFTHGMLDPWFKRNHAIKHLKKSLFWRLAGARMFRDAAAVLYTCEEEGPLAKQSFAHYECVERVVGLGITDPLPQTPADPELFRKKFPRLRDAPYLLYLGRITPKKGVDLLIEAFAEVYRDDRATCLAIAGPDENGLQARLSALPAARELGDRLLWTGPLYGDLKWSALSQAEAMPLCSHTENFAISVSEALALGVPVLITDKVNIWREIASSDAGFVEPDDRAGAVRLLSRWRHADAPARRQMKANARAAFERHFEISGIARRLVRILTETSGPGHPERAYETVGASRDGSRNE